MLKLPDFNRLKVFYFVYRSRSIGRAAEQMHVTASAVSQQITGLEEEMRTRLFDRSHRAITPTAAAVELYKCMSSFIGNLEPCLRNLEKMREGVFGTLRIACPPEFGAQWLTPRIGAFRSSHPDVLFQLNPGLPAEGLAALFQGKVDLAIIDAGEFYEKTYPISVHELLPEEQVLVGSKKYLQRIGKIVPSARGLSQLEYVSYVPEGIELKLWHKLQFGSAPNELNVVFSAVSVRSLINAIHANLGVGLIPRYLIEDALKLGRLVAVPARKKFINPIVLAKVLGKESSALEKRFIDFLSVPFTS